MERRRRECNRRRGGGAVPYPTRRGGATPSTFPVRFPYPADMHTLILAALLVAATVTPGPPVTDADVVARVRGASTAADELALSQYYRRRAAAEAPRIAVYDALFRAYMALEGKPYEALQRQARELLKAARQTRQHYELLAEAHKNRALAMSEQ